jgi:hypothetical protein
MLEKRSAFPRASARAHCLSESPAPRRESRAHGAGASHRGVDAIGADRSTARGANAEGRGLPRRAHNRRQMGLLVHRSADSSQGACDEDAPDGSGTDKPNRSRSEESAARRRLDPALDAGWCSVPVRLCRSSAVVLTVLSAPGSTLLLMSSGKVATIAAVALLALGLPAVALAIRLRATSTTNTAHSNPIPSSQTTGGVPEVGVLFTNASSTKHSCTASVVPSPRGDVLITAAHCVSGTGKGMVFAPGYHDGISPYGRWTVTGLQLEPGWLKSQDPGEDFAFLTVAAADRRSSYRDPAGHGRVSARREPAFRPGHHRAGPPIRDRQGDHLPDDRLLHPRVPVVQLPRLCRRH